MRVSSNGNPEYRVHYVNWKSKWDEWVDEARVLKFNSTNLKKEQVRIFFITSTLKLSEMYSASKS